MIRRTLIASLAGLFALATVPALADNININYDISHVGGYTSDPNTPVYGWPYPHSGMGTVVVTPTSADLTTDGTNAEVGALYLDTGLNVQSPLVSLSFDIDVKQQAATGYGQTKTIGGNDSPILFGVRVFGNNNWAASFQLSPIDANTGYFGFRDPDNAGLTTFGTYNTNTHYNVTINVDYAGNAASAFINGVPAITNFPLTGGANANATTSEIFAYLNGATGGAVNEVEISAVPLPRTAWLGLACIGVFGVGRFVVRKRVVYA